VLKRIFVSSLFFLFVSHSLADISSVYQQNCASCHGDKLQGGSASSLIDGQWQHGSSAEQIASNIKNGIPDLGMPAWRGAIDDKTIRGLVIFFDEQRAAAGREALLNKVRPKSGVYESRDHKFSLERLQKIDGVLWSLDFMPDESVLVTERSGKLWHYHSGELSQIKGIPEVWDHGQGGLMEVMLHPDYQNNKWIYLSYSDGGVISGGMTKVVRGKLKDGNWVDEQTIYQAPSKLYINSGHHFGSRFVFSEGYLYFSIGDRGRKAMSQDLGKPNGKIHRLHDDGRIPQDNPFVNTPGALATIWSYGHRNPQGMAIDPKTGIIWESEHGPRGGDEINFIERGLNYGWPEITYGMNYSGTPMTSETAREGMEQPSLYWVPSIAVSGIEFYNGQKFPKWQGKMLVAGMSSQELHLLSLDGTSVVDDEIILKNEGRIRDVGVAPDGSVYLLLNEGRSHGHLSRISPAN
jgi:glucose/arabinose dehydrogenase